MEELMFKKLILYGMFSTLGKVSPWVYILAYVAAIFGFAAIFQVIRTDFYHAYAQYEQAMGTEADQLRNKLTAVFREAARNHPHLSKLVVLDPEVIEVGS